MSMVGIIIGWTVIAMFAVVLILAVMSGVNRDRD